MNMYNICLLKGDGIGPEIVNEAVKVLDCVADKYGFQVNYDEALLGGSAIDAKGTHYLRKLLINVKHLTLYFLVQLVVLSGISYRVKKDLKQVY